MHETAKINGHNEAIRDANATAGTVYKKWCNKIIIKD